MRKYVNTRTGAVVLTECEIKGGGWREETPVSPAPKRQTKKGVKK